MTTELSPADISACTGGNNNDGVFGGEGIVGLIALLIVASMFGGFGGFGFGGNGGMLPWLMYNGGGAGFNGALTRGELCQDMNFNTLDSAVRSLQESVSNLHQGLQTAICNVEFSNAQSINNLGMNLSNEFRTTDNMIMQGGFNTQQAVNGVSNQLCGATRDIIDSIQTNNVQSIMNTNAIQTQLEKCCCENREIAMQNRFDMSNYNTNTLQAIDKLGDRIVEQINADRFAALERENAALRTEANNAALVNMIKPMPIPAYQSCNPWAASYGCGCNNGCGCG